jgi:outer membrane protein OmpA-like peptidoglycan-associated protein/tetratricopeptide (TPR) repeat protein
MTKKFLLVFIGFFTFSLFAQANKKCQALQDKAYADFQAGLFNEALSSIKKSIKCDPKSSTAYAIQAEIYETIKDSANAIKSHKMCIQTDTLYQSSYYYYAFYLFRMSRFDESLAALARYDKVPQMKDFDKTRDGASASMKGKVDRLRASIEMAKKDLGDLLKMEIQNMGEAINSPLNEYWPGMPINGNTFVFTRLVNNQEDFYVAKLGLNGAWEKARFAPGKINTIENEGTNSVYFGSKEQLLFYTVCNQGGFGSCDLFYSEMSNDKWGERKNMGEVVNSPQWDAQPSVSGDGNKIVFSSARPGGMGGKDLWMTQKVIGAWTKPVNLGPSINTKLDEEAPFIHYDGVTLYFASNGHPGYGQHDIFMSRLSDDGSWTKPENLGKGVNTSQDDVGFYVDASAQKAYFASAREGGFGGLDIYSIKLIDKFKPKPVNYLLGKVIDKETKKPISARVRLVNLQSQKVIFQDSISTFLIPVNAGNNYALHSMAKGYMLDSRNFQPTESTIDKPYIIEALLERIKTNQIVTLNNIFFDIDKYDLKPESDVELKTVLQLLTANPTMKIEISGHTDNTGSEVHNKELSANRATALKLYLEKLGIAPLRLIAKGYGASKPNESNDTEIGRAKNRRIEIRILNL